MVNTIKNHQEVDEEVITKIQTGRNVYFPALLTDIDNFTTCTFMRYELFQMLQDN